MARAGRTPDALPGLSAFAAAFKPRRTLRVGEDGIAVADFLRRPVEHWLQA